MRCRCFALAGAVAVTVVALAPISVGAQTSAPPVTSWGKPDLQGVWDFRSLTPMQRPSDLAEQEVFTAEEAATFAENVIRRESRDIDESLLPLEVAKGRVVPYNDFWFDWGTTVTTDRTSLIVDPPDGRTPPLTPGARSQRAARAKARRGVGTDEPPPGGWVQDLGASVRCIVGFNAGPPMTPSAYNNNMQLFQTADHVVILNEMIHHVRIVPLDRRPRLPQQIRQWMGSSRGRWEGNTAGCGDNQPPRRGLPRRKPTPTGHRALHAHGCEHARVRGHARGPNDVDDALDIRSSHDKEPG